MGVARREGDGVDGLLHQLESARGAREWEVEDESERSRLVFGGFQLREDDKRSLEELGLKEGSTVTELLSVQGGGGDGGTKAIQRKYLQSVLPSSRPCALAFPQRCRNPEDGRQQDDVRAPEQVQLKKVDVKRDMEEELRTKVRVWSGRFRGRFGSWFSLGGTRVKVREGNCAWFREAETHCLPVSAAVWPAPRSSFGRVDSGVSGVARVWRGGMQHRTLTLDDAPYRVLVLSRSFTVFVAVQPFFYRHATDQPTV